MEGSKKPEKVELLHYGCHLYHMQKLMLTGTNIFREWKIEAICTHTLLSIEEKIKSQILESRAPNQLNPNTCPWNDTQFF